jgi:hypothetical protein
LGKKLIRQEKHETPEKNGKPVAGGHAIFAVFPHVIHVSPVHAGAFLILFILLILSNFSHGP